MDVCHLQLKTGNTNTVLYDQYRKETFGENKELSQEKKSIFNDPKLMQEYIHYPYHTVQLRLSYIKTTWYQSMFCSQLWHDCVFE